MVRMLLGAGADVNHANSHGETPLREAAASGHTEIIRMLLEHGADANQDE